MVSHRLLHLKNGLIRSIIKPSSIASFRSTTAVSIGPGRRNLSLLGATKSGTQPTETASNAVPERIIQTIPHSAEAIIEEEEEEGIMNSQKESELLAMQYILGLKNAADNVKVKPKELERLERLKAAEPVFVCVDLEAYEFSQEKITEVGVSVLDSRHVIGTDPSADGSYWLSKIKTRHMIITEHKHLVNKRFVHGCPDKFNFGDSELVSLEHIRNTLIELFNNPTTESLRASDNGSRKLILVGHGLSNDTAYLNKLNFAPHAKGNILQDVDTQRFVGTKKTTVGLSKLMSGLGVETENLHNAGNDAAYTMQGLVLMTVQHTNDPGAYLKAVTNAKGKVDPAKQRYKDHKAKIREKKAADERAKVQAATTTGQVVRQDLPPKPNEKPPFTGPPREHQRFPAARQTIAGSSVETRPSWQAEQALSKRQTAVGNSHIPASVDHTPVYEDWLTGNRNPIGSERPPSSRAEIYARKKAGQQLLAKVGDQIPAFKKIPLAKDANQPTSPTLSSLSKQAERLVSPRKRKSSEPEPVPNNHVDKSSKVQQAQWDDDDFSISPAFYTDGDRGSRRSTRDDKKESELMADSQPHNGPVKRVQSKNGHIGRTDYRVWMNAESDDQPPRTTKMQSELINSSKSHVGPVRRVLSRLTADDEGSHHAPMNRMQYVRKTDNGSALPAYKAISMHSEPAGSSEIHTEPISITQVQSDPPSIHEDEQLFLRSEVEKHRQKSSQTIEEKDNPGT